MIVPMKKLTLLVLKKDRQESLLNLRKLGVVHIEQKFASSSDITDLKNKKDEIALAINLLSEFVSKKKNQLEPSLMNEKDSLACLDSVISLNSNYRSNIEKLNSIDLELEYYKSWGDFDIKDFDVLREHNLFLFPAMTSEKVYANLNKEIKTLMLGHNKKNVQFVIISESEEVLKNISSEVELLKMPAVHIKELRYKKETLEKKIGAYAQEMRKISAYLNSLKALDEIITKKLEFELVSEGMETVSLSETESVSEDDKLKKSLVYLTGYLPAEKESEFSEVAKINSWAFISKDPDEEDSVPTKLRYNKFFNLITPLLDFLGTLPGYREADISPFFLVFFGIFFAMIFGDAGYGSLILVMSVVMMIKSKTSGKKISTGVMFLGYLGFMTVIWGGLVCNWFGIPMNNVPEFLKKIAYPPIANFTAEDIRNQNQILLCFYLGLIQLLIGHLISFIRNIKTPKAIADIGSMAMLGGMFFVVLNLVVDGEKYLINNFVLLSIGIGFVLNFLFVNYSTGIVQSILDSVKNLINMFLGVVNVFADIMSYIRLWAVSLAGSAISATVNEMAGPMLGGFIIFAGFLLLVFGHGLNIIMTVLSVIVHGVRLNTLEFSNHVGLTWSGFKYEPFNE